MANLEKPKIGDFILLTDTISKKCWIGKLLTDIPMLDKLYKDIFIEVIPSGETKSFCGCTMCSKIKVLSEDEAMALLI